MANTPLVSVVLSAYNAEKYLKAAVQSILDQTFTDFELIVIDDGSRDSTLDILKSLKDKRIKIISRENKGLTRSLNEGIELARGKYIARQDADDLSLPDRFATEVSVLDADPSIGLVGSNYIIMNEKGEYVVQTAVFCHPDDLMIAEGISNQYGHGSIMMRKSVVEKLGGYDSSVGIVEDYDLFTRISHVAKIANISRPLYKWRQNPIGISLSNQQKQIDQAFLVRDREFRRIISNRKEYRIFTSFHPFVYGSGFINYLNKKSALFRDLAYLQWKETGKKAGMMPFLATAVVLTPWRKRNIKVILIALTHEKVPESWGFEFL